METSERLGIFSWFGYPMALPERLALIREAGFVTTSVWWGDEEELVRAGLGHTIPAMVADTGLALESIHVPFADCNDLWSDDAAAREALLARYRQYLEKCARQGIPRMVFHLTRGDDPPPLSTAGIHALARLATEAEAGGVLLAAENTRRPDYVERVFAEIPSPALGLCFDSSHANLYDRPPTRHLVQLGSRLVSTHWSDNDGTRDCHWLPGEGVIDWPALAEAFPSDTYEGRTMLEVGPKDATPGESPERFLSRACERGRWLVQLLASEGRPHGA